MSTPYSNDGFDPNDFSQSGNPYTTGSPASGRTGQTPYGTPPPQPVQKKGGCMKWGLIIGGVFLALTVLAVIFGESDTTTKPDSNNESVVSDTPAPETEGAPGRENMDEAQENNANEGVLQMGETADVKGLMVTASNFRDQGADVFGNNIVCADVHFQNDSDKETQVSQFDFDLTTPSGITIDTTISTYGELQTATVNPGGNLGGTVCFDSDAAPGEYKLTYAPVFSFRKAEWNATF